MIDKKIRNRVLKVAHDAKKMGKTLGIDACELADEWKEDKQKVISACKHLVKESLLKGAYPGMASSDRFVITDKGLREYERT